jgi:arginyl-tRNA synthetase
MQTITQKLTGIVSAAFEKCGYDPALGRVTVSDRPELCQFQCNGAMKGAKLYKLPPFKIATAVTVKLAENPAFEKVEMAMPGFINMTLKNEYLAAFINESAADPAKGMPQLLAGKKVLVDYGGPNVAKPLHIGHLRSAIIGESIKRICTAADADAFVDTHLGDWGLQMGLVISELWEREGGEFILYIIHCRAVWLFLGIIASVTHREDYFCIF